MDEPSSKNDKITPFQKIEVEESSDEEIDDVIDPDVTVTPAGEVGLIFKKNEVAKIRTRDFQILTILIFGKSRFLKTD